MCDIYQNGKESQISQISLRRHPAPSGSLQLNSPLLPGAAVPTNDHHATNRIAYRVQYHKT